MTDDAPILEPGRVIDGRYAVEGLIGRGGMAAVYRVRHVQLETQHALKVLTLASPSVTRRLVQEGRVQAALQHPNIVRVTDFVTVDDDPGLVMEYIRGPSLEALLAHRRPVEIEQLDALAVGILDGVAAAHALGLIHRDLKPANVMLAPTPDTLVPKVADFGLVKLVAGDDDGSFSKTRTGVAMGTPAYMAPEQIRDAKNVDARADVWSLGAILYELVTGHRAFDGSDVIELFVRIAGGDRQPVGALSPDLPERMVRAIEGALHVDRDQRFADVRALRAAWLEGAVLPVDSPWTPEWIELAASLGAGGDDTETFLQRSFRSQVRRSPPPASDDTWVPDVAGPTAVPEATPQPETVILDEPPPPPAIRRPVWPWLAAATLPALLLAGVATIWLLPPSVPDPAPEPEPEPVAQPDPEPEPVPVPVPVAAPEPVAAPAPAAAPVPVPVPDPEPAVAAADPEPAPVPVAPPTVTVDGQGISVLLLDAGGRTVAPAEVQAGPITVRAFFYPDDPERFEQYGPYDLLPGQRLDVRCFPDKYRCKVSL